MTFAEAFYAQIQLQSHDQIFTQIQILGLNNGGRRQIFTQMQTQIKLLGLNNGGHHIR